jgi:filamentous hemagglutinin family protein
MNCIFSVVWNKVTGTWQAVAENALGHVKSSKTVKAVVLASLGGLLSLSGVARAELPTVGQVVAGTGTISSAGNTMTIRQTSDRMAANWQSFSIGQGQTVNFVQPSSTAVALNRVLGSDVSVIQGALNANGKVFLLNPNGVLFTPTAQVNVGGIVASTLNLSTADFMAGNYKFEGNSSNAIINQGSITAAQGGTIALIAAKIINDGTLTATAGNVLLGAGSKVTLDMGGPVKLQVENDTLETLISNGGAIRADGGTVLLTSQAAATLASSVINNTGLIEANALSTGEKGSVILFAHGGTMNLGGSVQAEGGFVETSGKNFAVQPGASVVADNWLIDPVNVTIDSTLAGTIHTALGTGNVTITTDGSNTPDTASGEAAGAGNITVNAPISWSTNRTLTLSAANNIAVNADLTHTGTSAGGIIFLYGQGAAAGGSSAYSATGTVTSPSIQWRKGSDLAAMRYAIVDGNYFLGGQYIELGLCGPASTQCSDSGQFGKFGTSTKPSLFFGRNGQSGIGMVGDADGFGVGADLRIDYFLPGSPAEQFTVGFTGLTSDLKNFASTANSGSFGGFVVASDNTVSIKYEAVADSKLKVEQTIALKVSDAFFTNTVNLTNVHTGALDSVIFARSFDPDNTVDKGGNYDTVQKVEQTLAAGDGANVVSASSVAGDAYSTASGGKSAKILYYSTDASTQVGYGSDFFSGTSIASMASAAGALSKSSTASGDVGIGILYKPGTIAVGASKSFSYLTSLDNRDIATILTSLASVSVPTASVPTAASSSTSNTALDGAIARAAQQPAEIFRETSTQRSTSDMGSTGRPPVQVALPQANPLPVFDLSGGLAFVELASPVPAVGTGSTAGSGSGDAMTLLAGITGGDPLGFMRVFVTQGGINMPAEARADAGAESARRKNELNR